jgi:translation initiation factor 2A
MAEPTQLAFRTLKGIGILNAAPVYESLPGFERYVLASLSFVMALR